MCNYHDEEKTLKHQLFLIRTWDFLPALLALNGPGAPLLGSSYSHRTEQLEPLLPVRAHLYVTNFTRGAQVWGGIRVKLGPENGGEMGAQFRHISYFSDAMLFQRTNYIWEDSNLLPFFHPNCSSQSWVPFLPCCLIYSIGGGIPTERSDHNHY